MSTCSNILLFCPCLVGVHTYCCSFSSLYMYWWPTGDSYRIYLLGWYHRESIMSFLMWSLVREFTLYLNMDVKSRAALVCDIHAGT
jgi:hypothetical protein